MECNLISRKVFCSFVLLTSSLAFAQDATTEVRVNTDAWHAISSASPIVQLTLLLLVVMSVLTWAVGWNKHKFYNDLQAANDLFMKRFEKASSLDNIYEDLDSYQGSSISRVFRSGYEEMQRLAESGIQGASASNAETTPKLQGIDNMERSLRKTMDREVSRLEGRLNLLATTGSTAPFIGLFGTVWGIMGSFQKIGATGSASLAVVAPGIAEALIATAVGLAAAIPAVTMYNHFISRVRKQEIELESFSTDFLNIVKRNFFKE